MAREAHGRLGRAVGREYKVDGFRFDLMGHHSQGQHAGRPGGAGHADAAARTASTASPSTSTARAGTSARWPNNALFDAGHPGPARRHGIGTFSDRLRDAVRGGGPFDDDPRKQGFGTGVATDPNGVPLDGAATTAASLKHDTDLVAARAGRQPAGVHVRGPTRRRRRARRPGRLQRPAGRLRRPARRGDHLRRRPRQRDAVRRADLQAAGGHLDGRPGADEHAVAGHDGAGADAVVLARRRRPAARKSLDRNSYDSGDWFNRLDWTGADNGFGHGLPPQGATTRRSGRSRSRCWPTRRSSPTAADVAGGHGAGAGPAAAAVLDAAVPARARPRPINAKVTFPAQRHGRRPRRGDRHADRRHRGCRRRPAAQGRGRRVQRLAHERGACRAPRRSPTGLGVPRGISLGKTSCSRAPLT